MAPKRKDKSGQLMFRCYLYICKKKINTNQEIKILSKFFYIVNRIVFIQVLYFIDNFQLCKKNIYLLAKIAWVLT